MLVFQSLTLNLPLLKGSGLRLTYVYKGEKYGVLTAVQTMMYEGVQGHFVNRKWGHKMGSDLE